MALTRVASFNQDAYIGEVGSVPQRLFGVQSFNGEWELPLTPVKAAGYGLINYAPQGEIVGNVSISRFVTESSDNDPLVNYSEVDGGLLERPVSGFLAYGTEDLNRGFSFKDARITSYSSACDVGGIATSDFSLAVYGDMLSGTGVSTLPVSTVGVASANGISVEVSGSGDNAIQSYDFNINLNWSPLYGMGASGRPVGYRLDYPLEISVNFEMIVNEYNSPNVTGLMCSGQVENLAIVLRTGCGGEVATRLNVPNAELQGISFSSSVNDNLMASLSYVGYIPKSGLLVNVFPAL